MVGDDMTNINENEVKLKEFQEVFKRKYVQDRNKKRNEQEIYIDARKKLSENINILEECIKHLDNCYDKIKTSVVINDSQK